jgi:hypothetical protein
VAKKPETRLKEKVLGALHTLPNTWCVKVQQVAIRGTPDLLCCIAGRFVAIELKSDEQEPDALQAYTLNLIAEAGGIGMVVNPVNWPASFDALTDLAYNGEFPEEH